MHRSEQPEQRPMVLADPSADTRQVHGHTGDQTRWRLAANGCSCLRGFGIYSGVTNARTPQAAARHRSVPRSPHREAHTDGTIPAANHCRQRPGVGGRR